MKKFNIDTPKEEIEKILKNGIKKEIEETHAKGLSTRHLDDKGIYDLQPDRTKVYLK